MYDNKGKKLPFIYVLLFSLAFGGYAIIVGNPEIVSDRHAFYARFSNVDFDISDESVGLNFLFLLLRQFSLSANFLWFAMEFIYIFLTLLAYNYSKQTHYKALMLLMLSQYPIFGFYAFKQSICNAFCLLALATYFNIPVKYHDFKPHLHKIIPYIYIIVFSTFAILFHEAGYIIILVFVAMSMWSWSFVRKIGYALGLIILLFFSFFQDSIFGLIINNTESLATQVDAYAEIGVGGELSSIATVFKGVHFYIITIVGLIYRNRYYKKIEYYDIYLFLSFFSSMVVLMAGFMYWYFRFSMLVSLFVFVFATNIRNEMQKDKKNTAWYNVVVVFIFALSVKDLAQYYFIYGGI